MELDTLVLLRFGSTVVLCASEVCFVKLVNPFNFIYMSFRNMRLLLVKDMEYQSDKLISVSFFKASSNKPASNYIGTCYCIKSDRRHRSGIPVDTLRYRCCREILRN